MGKNLKQPDRTVLACGCMCKSGGTGAWWTGALVPLSEGQIKGQNDEYSFEHAEFQVPLRRPGGNVGISIAKQW